MALSVGDKLGPYEIVAPIGKGGMGEVYKALDTKLDREVAIKILPSALAQDPERLARFEREAKVLASLNHPNIAQVYAIEESSTGRALVMELVPGETLGGPLPLETALSCAKQIAEALEAAHDKSIIHRDLKPANIMVTPAGTVKVLDFGLAAVTQPSAASNGDPSNSPTLTMRATQAGMILGTAGYMAPEQAAGQPVDKRADIWSFGVVLYEMLTGQRLFTGDSIAHILADVLRAPIDFDKLPKETPRAIRDLLKRCLDRDVKTRLRDIGEARITVQSLGKDEEIVPTAPSRLGRLPWIAAAMLAIGATVAIAGWWRSAHPVEQPLKPLVRLDVDLGPDVALGGQNGLTVILSPDGSRLVYISQNRLFTRRLDQSKATELTGEGASAPFFSPDGKWVAFFSGGRLKKVSVEGGAAVPLCNASAVRGGSWGEDGNIVMGLANIGGLSRIPESGGAPVPLTELAFGESTHRWPQVLPGGKAVLFTANASIVGFDGANIEVVSLIDHRRKTLVRGGTFGRYLPSGHLIYVNHSTLFAVQFDLNALEVRGTPAPVLEEVAYGSTSGSAQVDFSRTGTLVYRTGVGQGLVTMQWLDSTGTTRPLVAKPGDYSSPRLSPDGNRLALSVTAGSEQDLWVYDWRRDNMTRFTTGSAQTNLNSAWSPDGRMIAFEAKGGVSWSRADAGSQPQVLTSGKNRQVPYSFTSDGKRLAFHELDPETGYDLLTIPVENDGTNLRAGKPEPFLKTQSDERHPSFSPDGRWLAYASNQSGTFEIYVRAFPDKGFKRQISNSSGMHPVWSQAAHELIFRTEDNQVMAATYRVQGDLFVSDKPRVWSEKRLADVGLGKNYDLAPDGKRIAALMPVTTPEGQAAQSHVVFLENFFDELRRRVPAGK